MLVEWLSRAVTALGKAAGSELAFNDPKRFRGLNDPTGLSRRWGWRQSELRAKSIVFVPVSTELPGPMVNAYRLQRSNTSNEQSPGEQYSRGAD